MFGHRARIGYISPSVIELIAYDFYRIVPDGVGMIGVIWVGGHPSGKPIPPPPL